jgi:alpha-galactosidase
MNIFKLKYRRSGVTQPTIELDILERYEAKNIVLEFSSMASELGNRISVMLKPKAPVVIDECRFTFDMVYDYKTITTNGYQSSSESIESDYNFKLYKLNFVAKLFSIANFGDYKTEKIFDNEGMLSHTYIQFNKEDGKNIRFYGSVNEENAFTIFNFNANKSSMCIYSDCKNRLVDDNFSLLDFIIAEGDAHKIYEHYIDYFPVNKSTGRPKNIWVTPHKISHKIKPITQMALEKNIAQIKGNKIPINTILINDSYQTRLGDFNEIDEKRFPDGMKAAADVIKDNGFEAGIWIAPFVAEKKSKLYKEHPDWFLKKVMNFNVSGGYNPDWSSKYFVLDVYKDEVANYINDMFKTIMYEWGFELIYLDLIYAAAIEARIDRTRAEIISDVSNFISKICIGRTIIASSLPIGSAMGNYDYCKISVDNAPFWEDKVMKRAGYKERKSIGRLTH